MEEGKQKSSRKLGETGSYQVQMSSTHIDQKSIIK